MEWIKTATLGEQSRWVLDQELRRLGQAEQDLKDVENRMEEATAGDPVVTKLMEQPGVGTVTAGGHAGGHRTVRPLPFGEATLEVLRGHTV